MQPSVFIDWIDISQDHMAGGLPIVAGGFFDRFDEDAAFEFRSFQHYKHKGSYDSTVIVKCDGQRVRLSGNVGRFNRPDNVFNLDFDQTIKKANWILKTFGLPPFTKGSFRMDQDGKSEWTGAKLSELHVTENRATFSEDKAKAFVDWIADRSFSRMKSGAYGGESAWFGNSRQSIMAYNKAKEMADHGTAERSPQLYEYCRDYGIVRIEMKLRRRALNDLHLKHLGAITMDRIVSIFREKTAPLFQATANPDLELLEAVPHKSRLVAAAWLKGVDVREDMSRATYFRHRKVLLECGIDISSQRKTATVHVIPKVIEMLPVAAPDWYWKREAA